MWALKWPSVYNVDKNSGATKLFDSNDPMFDEHYKVHKPTTSAAMPELKLLI